MKFEVFTEQVRQLIKKAGGGISATFEHDDDTGIHTAFCSDGTIIMGNSETLRLTVRWNGSNHQACFE